MVFTKEWQTWNVTDTDDGTVGDSELTNDDDVDMYDMPFFIFYFAFGTSVCLLFWQVYFKKCRGTHGADAEIPEPQASSHGEEVVKKSVGERRKELLAGFQEQKVQRVSKLEIDKKYS